MSNKCNGEWRVSQAASSHILQPVMKPDRFLESRNKFIMCNIGYIIEVQFKTIFTEDAMSATVESHGHGSVASASSMHHTGKGGFVIATEFCIIE